MEKNLVLGDHHNTQHHRTPSSIGRQQTQTKKFAERRATQNELASIEKQVSKLNAAKKALKAATSVKRATPKRQSNSVQAINLGLLDANISHSNTTHSDTGFDLPPSFSPVSPSPVSPEEQSFSDRTSSPSQVHTLTSRMPATPTPGPSRAVGINTPNNYYTTGDNTPALLRNYIQAYGYNHNPSPLRHHTTYLDNDPFLSTKNKADWRDIICLPNPSPDR